jgi:hypothetical protein
MGINTLSRIYRSTSGANESPVTPIASVMPKTRYQTHPSIATKSYTICTVTNWTSFLNNELDQILTSLRRFIVSDFAYSLANEESLEAKGRAVADLPLRNSECGLISSV